MSMVLQRIEQTREALEGALAERNWAAIGELDQACRACMDEVLEEAKGNEPGVRNNLERLLGVYRELIDVATGERQAIADEMTQIQQARNAAKVYHLFR